MENRFSMTGSQPADKTQPSKILLEELFAAQDDRFMEVFVQFQNYETLKRFTIQWLDDSRPWARDRIVDYLGGRLNHPGHEVVVKTILKTALQSNDLDLIIELTVAMDGLVRRNRVTGYSYDRKTRSYQQREYLFAKPNRTIKEVSGRFHEYRNRRQTYRVPLPDIRNRPGHRLFSHKTRAHIRRRLWRKLRLMAQDNPNRYLETICKTLAKYEDSFFTSGEAILDNWSLMHACYFHAKEIAFTASHTNLVAGHSLATLASAPYRPELWDSEHAAVHLWELLAVANSQFVRMWSIEMLRSKHASWLSDLGIESLLQMLSSRDSTVAEFAAELFHSLDSLSNIEISIWLQLIEEADFSVLPTLCEAMKQHIAPERLGHRQLIELTTAAPAAVARLGFDWLQTRHQQSPLPVDLLVRLSNSKCDWEAEAIASWAIHQIADVDSDPTNRLIEFFDSHSSAVRIAACRWLTDSVSEEAKTKENVLPSKQWQDEPALWVKLAETPYDQVRFALVERLNHIQGQPKTRGRTELPISQQLRVLAAVVLCVERGSRSKPKAIHQLAALAITNQVEAKTIVSVLAVASRSVRGPERAAGLSALATVAQHSSLLKTTVEECLTEWDWFPEPSPGEDKDEATI